MKKQILIHRTEEAPPHHRCHVARGLGKKQHS
jgi:hypothetical protein